MSKSMSYEEYSRVPMREPRAQAMFEAVERFDLVELRRLVSVCPWSLAAPITGRKVSSALSMALCSFGSAELSELASLVPAEVLLHPVAGDWACKAMSGSPATASFQFLKLGQEHWGGAAASELARNLCLEAGGSDEGVLAFSSSRSVWMQEDMALFWEALDGLSKERCDTGHRSLALSAAVRCWTDALGAIVRPFCEPSVDLDKLGMQACVGKLCAQSLAKWFEASRELGFGPEDEPMSRRSREALYVGPYGLHLFSGALMRKESLIFNGHDFASMGMALSDELLALARLGSSWPLAADAIFTKMGKALPSVYKEGLVLAEAHQISQSAGVAKREERKPAL